MSYTQWDRHAAVEHLRRQAQPASLGRCAHFVSDAILEGNIPYSRPPQAKDSGQSLLQAGFTTAPAADPDCVGDVVVLPAIPKPPLGKKAHPDGHVAMFDGANWISDFVQQDVWGGPDYRTARPAFVRYRLRAQLPPQHRRKFTNRNVQRTVLPRGTRLFKFTEWELRAARPTEWWALVDADARLGALGYLAVLAAARAEAGGVAAFARRHFAVMLDWNGLSHRQSGLPRVQFAQLVCAVEALHGTCARVRQPRAVGDDPRPDLEYPGGFHQVFLPQVASRELQGGAIVFVG